MTSLDYLSMTSLSLHEDDDYDVDYDDDDRPGVYRSGTVDAYTAWSTSHLEEEHGKGASWALDAADSWSEALHVDAGPKRCVLPDADPFWDEISSLANLEVVLKPHRTEPFEGGIEHLVNSIRPFTVLVTIVDPASDRAISGWQTMLRARLVYADTGEPVPVQKGESPLSGELEKVLKPTGEACALRLRAAALSYNHGRRAFAVRIEADELPGGRHGVHATSPPLRAVARLPNASTAPKIDATPATVPAPNPFVARASPASAAPQLPSLPSLPPLPPPTLSAQDQCADLRAPTFGAARAAASPIVVEDDGVEDEAGWETDEDEEEPAAPRPMEGCVPAQRRRLVSPSSLVTQRSFGSDGSGAATESSTEPRCTSTLPQLAPSPSCSTIALLGELRAQGELLRRALAQQNEIMQTLSEMQRHRLSSPAIV